MAVLRKTIPRKVRFLKAPVAMTRTRERDVYEIEERARVLYDELANGLGLKVGVYVHLALRAMRASTSSEVRREEHPAGRF